MKRFLGLLVLLSLWQLPAAAQSTEEEDRATQRLEVELGGGVFGRHPGGVADPGGALLLAKPLWLGQRWRFFQLEASVAGLLGFGSSVRLYTNIGVTGGLHLYLGRRFSLEWHLGPALGAQIGENATFTAGLLGQAGYVLHPWADHRRRIKLGMLLGPAGALSPDPGNDCGACNGFLGAAVGYEAPF